MLLDEAVRIGEAAESRNAWELTMSLRWFMHAELANWDQVGDLAAAFDPDAFGAPWAYVTRALLTAQTGDRSLARGQLDAVAPRLRGMERDSEWLPTMAQVAELVGLVGGHPVAAWMYEALPHRDRFAVEGIGAAVRGPVERDLGVVAATLGRDEAAGHFDAAVAACERIGAACLAARTLRDAEIAIDDAARLQAARAAYEQLGAPNRVAEFDALTRGAPTPRQDTNVFRRDGELCQLAFAGTSASLRTSKGLEDLARLLAQPGVPIPAVDLATPFGAPPRSPAGEDLHAAGDLGEMVSTPDGQRHHPGAQAVRARDARGSTRPCPVPSTADLGVAPGQPYRPTLNQWWKVRMLAGWDHLGCSNLR